MEALVCYCSDDDGGEGDVPAAREPVAKCISQREFSLKLKGKQPEMNPHYLEASSSSSNAPTADHNDNGPKVCALVEMGFSASAVWEVLQNSDEGTPIETLVHLLTDSAVVSTEETTEPSKVDLLVSFGFLRDRAELAVHSCGDAELGVLIQFMEDYQKDDRNGNTMEVLQELGYSESRALKALAACGNAAIDVIVDFLDAHELSDDYEQLPSTKRARLTSHERAPRGDMTGFGLPGRPGLTRQLSMQQRARPYFYFENVCNMPQGEWDEISGALDYIKPEFVDSMHFSVTRRARGYIHNLPIDNRFLLQPVPPMTIRKFFPHTVPFTPTWDTREKIYCIHTVRCGAPLLKEFESYIRAGPTEEQKTFMKKKCKFWNLVWTGPGICSPLEPHEIEPVMGYPIHHTRGGITMSEQLKSLGNAFQVDTVGYHLSALKAEFSAGIRVLSLFSGIGGAEVALHRADGFWRDGGRRAGRKVSMSFSQT